MADRLRTRVSFSDSNWNCPQEAGSVPAGLDVTLYYMESRYARPRLASPSISAAGWMLMLILLALEWLSGRVSARAAVVAAPHVTLVVFADRPMADDQWTLLAATLQIRFEDLALETHFASSGVEVIRGDRLAPGAQFEEVMSIYLHGDCHVHVQPGQYTVHGALGWVLLEHGAIKPFIHVDCARISEMIGQHVFGLNANSRDSMMAEAVTRVVLHEWLHISTQNASPAREGIFKPSFSVADLIPGYTPGAGHLSRGK